MPLIEDKEALFLAMLLHDTGKGGAGGQEAAGARAARQACERLGLDHRRVDLVAWVVEHHLTMSDFAQKRDITDPSTVAAFARIVETLERLRLLLVLTVADIRAVGPAVWNGWKGQLLRELYSATLTLLSSARVQNATGLARRRREAMAYEARAALIASDPAAEPWAKAMGDAYFTSFAASERSAHRNLWKRALAGVGAAAEARIRADRDAAEITVAAKDRRALFADLALAIATYGGNVVGARIFTSENGEALDVFYVQDSAGEPFGEHNLRAMKQMTQALENAALGRHAVHEDRKPSGIGRGAAFTIAPVVTIDNDASDTSTVIETSGRDRPGLLEALARTLSEADLSVRSAHVDSHGERAVDAFYVVTADGGKLVQNDRAAALRARLAEVLRAAEPKLPVPSRSKARSSAAR
jgi:[protein-PII] uridylyltransferase